MQYVFLWVRPFGVYRSARRELLDGVDGFGRRVGLFNFESFIPVHLLQVLERAKGSVLGCRDLVEARNVRFSLLRVVSGLNDHRQANCV